MKTLITPNCVPCILLTSTYSNEYDVLKDRYIVRSIKLTIPDLPHVTTSITGPKITLTVTNQERDQRGTLTGTNTNTY